MSVTTRGYKIGMEGRLITGDQREFRMPAWDGFNRSGWQPLDDKVLVLMDEHVELTSGGIVIPGAAVERQSVAAETGLIIALGPAAFVWNDEATRAWTGKRPEAGDRCYLERYSGQLLQGVDSRHYRLVSQRCVGAVALAPDGPVPPIAVPVVEPAAKSRRRRN